MKKLLLSVAVLAFMSAPAFADDKGGKDKMDKNGDGLVSQSEFMAKQQERFEDIDANNDGSIEKSEFKAAREKWKGNKKDRKEQRQKNKGADTE